MTTAAKLRTKWDPPTHLTIAHAGVLHENISWLAPEEIRGLQERLHCLTNFHLPFFPPSFLLSSSSSTTSACLASSLSSRSQPSSTRARFAGVRRGDQGCRQASRPAASIRYVRECVYVGGWRTWKDPHDVQISSEMPEVAPLGANMLVIL